MRITSEDIGRRVHVKLPLNHELFPARDQALTPLNGTVVRRFHPKTGEELLSIEVENSASDLEIEIYEGFICQGHFTDGNGSVAS